MDIVRDFVSVLGARLSQPLNFIQVVLGPRQVGKTTGVQQIAEAYSGTTHYTSADSVTVPDAEWLIGQWSRARAMGRQTLLIIDEIQRVEGWSNIVKGLFDEDRPERKLQVVLLGSASLSLHRGLAESLAGRFELIFVPHWSYAESQEAFGWSLEPYLQYGGYPAPAELIGDPDRWTALVRDSIVEPVIARDILSLASVQKPALLRQVFELAMAYPAQEISFQKLLGQLQDRGNAATVKHYLELLEQAFIIKLLYQYSTRPITVRSSSPKLLPMATALITAIAPRYAASGYFASGPVVSGNPTSSGEHLGRVFEAAIGAHLSLFFPKLSYWRKGADEVDYVFSLDGITYALEVKSGRKKKAGGLQVFARNFSNSRLLLLDRITGEKFLTMKKKDDVFQFLREMSFAVG